MKNLTLLSTTVLAATSGILIATSQAASALTWKWSYSGTGIAASGTFLTNNTPDSSGFYSILGITGTRNGETITGLQPTGTPIPGNEPFEVDNLIRFNFAQLTGDGFGYSTSGGNYVSPFFASFLSPPGYLEYFSAPPFNPLPPESEDSEIPITFSATLVPEPSNILGLVTVVGLGFGLKRRLNSRKSNVDQA